ncbi:MAG: SDR family oxidoreductase [Bacteroidales bacterium]|nr:SDR family oxidoreductase [Bacteroidales bacterium]
MKDLFDLTGKVAVVTGGNGILGRSMCEGLCGKGAKVAILGRKKESGEQVAADICANGGDATFFVSDVLNIEQLKLVKSEILAKYGHIDILVNAAGGNMPGASVQPGQSIFDVDMDAMRTVIELNYFGTLYPIRVFAEDMVKQGHGNIINITSASAERPLTRVLGYSSAKAAVKNMTEWLAVEFAQKYGENFRINALTPGFFLTEQNRFLLTNQDGSLTPRGSLIIQGTPQGRMGNPEDLQGALIYLASDASRFVTGTTTIVDGGFNAFSGV